MAVPDQKFPIKKVTILPFLLTDFEPSNHRVSCPKLSFVILNSLEYDNIVDYHSHSLVRLLNDHGLVPVMVE
jgi:hypothetical protein